MPREINELASRLDGYADAIAGFSFAQAVAFGLALGSNDFAKNVVRAGWLILPVLFSASGFYAYLIRLCHSEEDCLEESAPKRQQESHSEKIARALTLKIRHWRVRVVWLGAFLSFLAVGATWYGKTHPDKYVSILFWEKPNIALPCKE